MKNIHLYFKRDKFNWLAIIAKFWLIPEFIHDTFLIKDTFISLAFKLVKLVIVLTFKLFIAPYATSNKNYNLAK